MEYDFIESLVGGAFTPTPTKNGIYSEAKGGTEAMYDGLMKRLPEELSDKFQIICSRVREIDPKKKQILWLHDTWDDPENTHLLTEESKKRFSKFVFVSNMQFQSYHMGYKIPYSTSAVLKNAIDPIDWVEKPNPKDRINLIYHTTPHRGLELLVPAFDHLSKMYPNLYLDVYSSFKIYGWPAKDRPYENLFEFCRNHPRVTYHGTKPNSVVREALKKAHIFAFPSIWPETSCIAAIEAMSAGCAVVSSDLAALPETLMNYGFTYRFDENPQEHVNRFASVLNSVILKLDSEDVKSHLTFQRKSANMMYSWESRIPQWISLLNGILENGQN